MQQMHLQTMEEWSEAMCKRILYHASVLSSYLRGILSFDEGMLQKGKCSETNIESCSKD